MELIKVPRLSTSRVEIPAREVETYPIEYWDNYKTIKFYQVHRFDCKAPYRKIGLVNFFGVNSSRLFNALLDDTGHFIIGDSMNMVISYKHGSRYYVNYETVWCPVYYD